ncbi:MAG: vitamin K epoxide reductase family protein [bacterium]|nr:vitamin K epoxide reductase family protein [bacterium]
MTPPKELSYELRTVKNPHMQRRRWIMGLSLVGAAMGQIVSLFQMGIVKRLPDPPVRIFNSTKVDASAYAYRFFDMPDAPLMIINYGLTAAFASAGRAGRARLQPILPVLMAVKIAGDVVVDLELAREEWAENKALCFYCQTATVISLISLVLALPEALEGLRHLDD